MMVIPGDEIVSFTESEPQPKSRNDISHLINHPDFDSFPPFVRVSIIFSYSARSIDSSVSPKRKQDSIHYLKSMGYL